MTAGVRVHTPEMEEKKDHLHSHDVQVVNPNDVYRKLSLSLETGQVPVEGVMATKDELLEMADKLDQMPLDRCRTIMAQIYEMHKYDQNFPQDTLDGIKLLMHDPDVIAHPEKHTDLINSMKLEALLVTENSPYAEVRGVVDNFDDPSMPSLTFRVWVIGVFFAGAGAFINQLFSVRQPAVYVTSNVAQLLAWPFGKVFEKCLPTRSFRTFGREWSLNPGPFNKKEHMLITIMATVAFNTPYTGSIVFVQALPQFFNQPYAKQFGYQILNSLGSNFVGYGIAGMCRRFLVYPAFCVWPSSLTSLAINKAFHSDDSAPVAGPFNRTYRWSRMKLFLVSFIAMFCYWWFPAFIFTALGQFNWLAWIAPNNANYIAMVDTGVGLGINPWPTFDFQTLMFAGWTPLVLPLFSVVNQFLGMFISMFMIIGFYYTNAFNTGYLPINSNKTWDNTGARYNVSLILDDKGEFSMDKYQQYSEPWMAAGNLTVYFWFFATYAATVSYTALYHRHEVITGFRAFFKSVRKSFSKKDINMEGEDDLAEDIHFRLMKAYKEVPEWWFFIVLCCALVCGCVGVGVYPTNTTPAVVVFGIIMTLIFVVPVGLICAVCGVQVTMNVLAEFIGGSFAEGNALQMNYFKMYGYISCAQAVYFSGDLKLAHYTKIPPRHTFWCQMVATLVSTFVCTAIFNFQMAFRDVCTDNAAFNFYCPGEQTFFTASVFWGTIGPRKIFGPGGHFTALLAGFPVGFILPFITFGLARKFPRVGLFRQLHPVMICAGAINWAPYNISYLWPSVIITWISWGYIKKRYLAFWTKYNYVLAAAFTAGLAVAAIIIFFAVQLPGVEIDWWGNDPSTGCSADICTRLEIPEKGYFGADPGFLH